MLTGMTRLLPCLLALLLSLHPARAETPAEAAYRSAFSAERLGMPPPSAALALDFTLSYRGAVPHAAFAVARDAAGRSSWTFVGGRATPEAAAADALAACRARVAALAVLAAECRVLARDGAVEGAAPVPLAEGGIGPFRASPLHLRRGPEAARGVLVWGHGYGGAGKDNRNRPTPGLVAALNDAGWDVLRFDRHPGDDALTAALPRLIAGLPALRAAGYRRILLGGQSRGGWQAILAGSANPALVEAVIATAPAAHGEATRGNNLGAAVDDFRRLLAGLPAEGPRLLVALFDGDDFDPDPERRAAMLEALAAQRPAPLLALWPQQGIRGHRGATNPRFAQFFAGCVMSLVQAPPAAAPRGLRRAPCGGG
jgi:pimeloyl-ACP methyl ester carboxylesterase